MKIIYSNAVFIDTAYSLIHEYANNTDDTLCILGAIDFCKQYEYEDLIAGYRKVIIYNQEPLEPWMHRSPTYYEWLRRADEVWDYDEINIIRLRSYGIHATLHVLKPYMNWSLYAPVPKDIDILFIGTLWPRRKHVLDFLQTKHHVVSVDNHIYGNQLDQYILRSKILLNIHGTTSSQEQARMIKWIGAPCDIISEKSNKNYLGVNELDYWELYLL